MMFAEHELAILTVDFPEQGLVAGDVGMIVHIYGDHKGYVVEFVTLTGELVALVSVYPHQIRPLEVDEIEIATARRVKSA